MSKPKSKHGNRYSPEFKREAVLYYRSSGKSFKTVAEELGVSDATLCTWNKEMKEQENPQPWIGKSKTFFLDPQSTVEPFSIFL